MKIEYYPDKKTVGEAIQVNDPLLVLISYDGKKILISNIDDSCEHIILLRQLNYDDAQIDQYFRIILNNEGADWTFVCPSSFRNIKNKNKRIEKYYNDGMIKITEAIKKLGYDVEVNIPKRYRRHFNMLGEDSYSQVF